MKYTNLLTDTPQSEPLDERQVENNAGGFVYQIDDWDRLDRFLILGSDSNTYYQTAQKLTRENAKCVQRCFEINAARTVARIVEISDAGRAPRNDPAVFALALGAVSEAMETRQIALAALPKVCRTATHLFQFVGAVRGLGKGWGRALKRAVAQWYEEKTTDKVAYQAIKYRSREGYTHKRLLQTAHPNGAKDADPSRTALYRWICDKDHDADKLPVLVRAHLGAMESKGKSLTKIVAEHSLPWEAIPTEAKKDPDIWKALLPSMGLTAMIRNLGVMTACEALKPMSDEVQFVAGSLRDDGKIKKSRVHPFAILQALAVYRSGQGVRGSLSWLPDQHIIGALDDAFYLAFANAEPTGKRILIALDVSGSMSAALMGSPLSAAEGSAAMALVTMRTEPRHHVVGFSAAGIGAWSTGGLSIYGRDGITPLPVTPKQRLDDVMREIRGMNFGSTDCALPMLYAMERGLDFDAFVIFTDNETWHGQVHPMEALKKYRKKTGINAKLIVVGMTSTGFSIADPNDDGALDIVGFDAGCPPVIADFIRK